MQLLQPIPIMPGPNQCRNTPRFPAPWISGTVAAEVTAELVALNLQPVAVTSIQSCMPTRLRVGSLPRAAIHAPMASSVSVSFIVNQDSPAHEHPGACSVSTAQLAPDPLSRLPAVPFTDCILQECQTALVNTADPGQKRAPVEPFGVSLTGPLSGAP